ncbi:MerR family transcriptional regulator [Brachybacterium sp. EF45031]|uniref:MerR family transcriptional regulator n=1 Tax=Brachybacterium sillae TaxID=2810536 RepID=UPI00217DF6A6|nr:MerR family transcriptional regulator [Brachybacterium sillae]MCS6712486.1 MerR family transcriptional regulator [Brachybacterium sillae]
MSRRHDPIGSPPELRADQPFCTIGQVAEFLGTQPAALRRLDELDVVSPGRSTGGQRRYSLNELDWIREVLSLTEEGVTLPGVRRVLELRRRVADLEAELAAARLRLGEMH